MEPTAPHADAVIKDINKRERSMPAREHAPLRARRLEVIFRWIWGGAVHSSPITMRAAQRDTQTEKKSRNGRHHHVPHFH